MRVTYLIIACLLLKAAFTQGQNFSHIKHYTTDDGLPHNVGYKLMQDSKGFLWVCTDDGLARFDGNTFKVYRSTNGLLSNYPVDVAESEDGTLWIGSWKGGVNYLKDDSIYTPAIDFPVFRVANIDIQGDRMMLSNEKIRAYSYQKKGNVWKFLNSKNNTWLFFKNDSTILYDKKNQHLEQANLKPLEVSRSYLTTDQSMLVFTGVAGVWKYQNDSTFTAFYPAIIKKDTIYHVSQDTQQRYWLGGRGKILMIDPKGQTKIWTKNLPFNNIYDVKHGIDGKIYFLTGIKDLNQRGLYAYDPVNEQLEDLKKKYNLKTFPSYLEVDKEGNLWFTTNGDGLYCITYSPFKNYDQQQGLTNSFARRIIQDKYGDIYVGTVNGLYRLQSQVFHRIPLLPEKPTVRINSLGLGPNHHLLVTAEFLHFQGNKLFRVDHQQIEVIQKEKMGKSQFLDRHGQQWFFLDNKLSITSIQTVDNFSYQHHYYFAQDFLIHQLLEYQGKYWMATNQGVYAFKETRQQAEPSIQFLDSIKVAGGLLSNFVNTIVKGNQGELWIGTNEGLSKFKNGVITNYTTQNGLASNNCTSILVDHRGHLWVGTSKGLSYFDGQRFINYNHKTGLASPAINCLFLDNHNQLWIGTTKGISVLDISHSPKVVLPPRLYIETVTMNGEVVNVSSKITINYDQGLDIRFQALSFVHPEGIRYQYRLNGGKWKETPLNFVNYNRFSSGNQVFEVRARKFNSEWSSIQTIAFEVTPPRWRTWWAIGLYNVLLLWLVYQLVNWRIKKLHKDKLRLEKLVAKRTQELEHQKEEITSQAEKLKEMDQVKSRLFSNISHEFKTPLTLIIGPAEKLLALKLPPAQTYTQYILANAHRLMRLINQLMDVSKIDNNKMSLQTTRGNLVTFIKQVFHSFELLAQQKNIQMELQVSGEELIGDFDEDKLEKIFFNLLSNALKFTPHQGQVKLSLESLDDRVKVIVSDSGVGIPATQLPFIFDRFYQADDSGTRAHEGTGIGLSLVKELIDLHQGTIEVVSKPNQGTTFTVHLPFVQTSTQSGVNQASTQLIASNVLTSPATITPEEKLVVQESNEARNTILIIEDNVEIRGFIAAELAPFYEVLEAKNGEEGIELGLKHIPDLIITDVMMPKVDGFEVVKTLRENLVSSHIPILILSAKIDFESKMTGLEMGSDDYLTKPFSVRELLLRVKNRLDHRDKIREAFAQQISTPEMVAKEPGKRLSYREETFLKKATEIVEQNIDNLEFDVTHFCQEIGMSRSNLFRKLKALTNLSIVEFTRTIRLKKAAILLRETDDKIEVIALQVGFNYVTYFNKCFKQQFGVSPSEYK